MLQRNYDSSTWCGSNWKIIVQLFKFINRKLTLLMKNDKSDKLNTILVFSIILGWIIISNVWFFNKEPDILARVYLIFADGGSMAVVLFLEIAFKQSARMQLWDQPQKPVYLPIWLGLSMLISGMTCLYGASPLLKYGVNNPEYRLQVIICASWFITIIVMYLFRWHGYHRHSHSN
jgi:hypothetical protein